jgi:hypothetical protein
MNPDRPEPEALLAGGGQGFTCSPSNLGFDRQGREMLSYRAGLAGSHPRPPSSAAVKQGNRS